MYDKEVYERYKTKNAARMPELRRTCYLNYKEAHPEKLAEIRKEASKRYYEANKEKVQQQNLERYHLKKAKESVADQIL
jgi:uncharacterized protein YdcH (DUF465 family)